MRGCRFFAPGQRRCVAAPVTMLDGAAPACLASPRRSTSSSAWNSRGKRHRSRFRVSRSKSCCKSDLGKSGGAGCPRVVAASTCSLLANAGCGLLLRGLLAVPFGCACARAASHLAPAAPCMSGPTLLGRCPPLNLASPPLLLFPPLSPPSPFPLVGGMGSAGGGRGRYVCGGIRQRRRQSGPN